MSEIEFIIITIFLVIFIIFIANKIISKRNRQKKIIPKGEKFNGGLNNLEKIIEGVSLKKNKDLSNNDKEISNEKKFSDYEKRINKKAPTKKNIYKSKEKNKTKKINLKDTIIASEILKRKKN